MTVGKGAMVSMAPQFVCPWENGAVWCVVHDIGGSLYDTCASIFTGWRDSTDVGIIRGVCHMYTVAVGEGCTSQPSEQGECSLRSEQCLLLTYPLCGEGIVYVIIALMASGFCAHMGERQGYTFLMYVQSIDKVM